MSTHWLMLDSELAELARGVDEVRVLDDAVLEDDAVLDDPSSTAGGSLDDVLVARVTRRCPLYPACPLTLLHR